ncbi:MAG: glycosyltransferase [Sedimentisphaerales bacterium]
MSDVVKRKATICVVNYKTLFLTMLCLRCIRKFTRYPYEVIVIDNDSRDESLNYLKSLTWIRLIERRNEPGMSGGSYTHGASLDLGLQNCSTEFFVTLHSDAFVQKENWLSDLVSYFNDDENTACVGSGKIEIKPKWETFLKNTFDMKKLENRLFHGLEFAGRSRYYNRTICCLYRTETLLKEKLSFLMGNNNGLTPGKKLYFELVDRGYRTLELSASLMADYVFHLGHGTQVVHPEQFSIRRRTIRKGNRALSKVKASRFFQSICADNSLDN